MNGEHRVEEMRETDALRLGDEPKQVSVAVEAPRPTLLDDFDARLVVAIEQLVGDLARRVLVGEFERLGAEPLDADDRNQAIWQNALNGGVGRSSSSLLMLAPGHALRPSVMIYDCCCITKS